MKRQKLLILHIYKQSSQ